MDLKALHAFDSIARHGSLTRAAAALGLAQSVLSRRISALERELGGRLFYRTGRGVVPTELGARLQPRAHAIVAESDALVEEARGALSSPAGTVTLALVPAIAKPLVSALSARVRRDFPRIRLNAQEAYSGQVEEWLANGQIDVGVFNRYGRGGVRDAELLLTSTIALVAPRDRFAIRGPDVPFKALDGLPLVLPSTPNPLVAMIQDLAARQRVTINIVLEARSSALTHGVVADAGLCTLVPLHLAHRDYGNGRFVIARIVKPMLGQKTWLAVTTQRPATIAVRTVARLAHELAPRLAKMPGPGAA
jgi:DNA-binding transcriptional LysR family regulator